MSALSDAELEAIEAAADDPMLWGSGLCSPTNVVRLDCATVAWINQRWFIELGVDTASAATRERLDAWLLQEFAWRTDDQMGAPSNRTLGADRYGATGQVAHGGSGRAVVQGHFQVKGVGRTPLVGKDSDWFHSHGNLWMEEAIREAFFSELFALERGGGMVPVIAIIDTGLNLAHGDGTFGERRALCVRPFAPRLAHLQRAFGFAPLSDRVSIKSNRAQRQDTVRVRGAWRAYYRAQDRGHLPPLDELFGRIGAQAAFCHVWKLSHGGFFSSNLTLDGRLIDFGSATAMAGWDPQPVSQMGAWFGAERENVLHIAQSLCFHAKRFAAAHAHSSVDELMRSFDAGYARARAQHLLRHCGRAAEPIFLAALDQAVLVGRTQPSSSAASQLAGLGRAAPRLNAQRETLQQRLFDTIAREQGTRPPAASEVDTFLRSQLSTALRAFPAWADLGEIVAQATDGATTLVIDRWLSELPTLRIDAPLWHGQALIFGTWHALSELVDGESQGARWKAKVELASGFSYGAMSLDSLLGSLRR